MSESLARLDVLVDALRPANLATARRITAFENGRDAGARYQVVLHWFIRASVSLLRDAAVALAAQGKTALSDYCARHSDEERDHDTWLLQDLRETGLVAGAQALPDPSTPVAQLVGSQYYWIRHVNPEHFFGYVYALESSPPTLEFIAALEARAGVPAGSFTCLRHHATVDPGHRGELLMMLCRHVTDFGAQQAIKRNFVHTVAGLLHAVNAELAPGPRGGSAAPARCIELPA